MSKRNRQKRQQPPSLDQAMQTVLDIVTGAERGAEHTIAYLHLWSATGELTVAALAVSGGGPASAAAARGLIAAQQPVVAVLASEAWMAEIDARKAPEEQDWAVREWLERRARGEDVGVVDLPPDYRSELLLLVGEDRDGNERDAFYRIRPAFGEGAKRTFEPLEMEGYGNRFRPLFALEWGRRQGIPDEVVRARLVAEMRQAGLVPPPQEGGDR